MNKMMKRNGHAHVLGAKPVKDEDKVPTVLWVVFGTLITGVVGFGLYEALRKK